MYNQFQSYQQSPQFQQFGQYPNQYQYQKPEPPKISLPSGGSGRLFLGILIGFALGVVAVFLYFYLKVKQALNKTQGTPAKPQTQTVPEPEISENDIRAFMATAEPQPKQTWDDFLEFLRQNDFEIMEELEDVSNNEIWQDNIGNQIIFGQFDFKLKKINGEIQVFAKTEIKDYSFNNKFLTELHE